MLAIGIGIDPIIGSFGAFSLRWYGLFVALAVLTGILVAVRLGRRVGLPEDMIYGVALWGVPGGIVGSRLFHVIDKWEYYSSHPAQIFSLQAGGEAIFGAIIGGAITGAIYAKVKGLPVGRIADVAAPGIILAQIVGRFGCIINGDAYGAPTSLPWAFIYNHPNALAPLGVATQPYPVYEQLWDLVVFAILWRLWGWRRPPGALFFVYLSVYSFGRFFLTFLRQEEKFLFGLQEAHVVSLVVLAIGVFSLLYLLRQQPASAVVGESRSERINRMG
ncbi:MAG: prolipoprotein diacylglyceryl transferase [Chloroflexi bacterium]|nr:prolipoprotein diacylglyceryl transferase [Chloroflexota bacterium]